MGRNASKNGICIKMPVYIILNSKLEKQQMAKAKPTAFCTTNIL